MPGTPTTELGLLPAAATDLEPTYLVTTLTTNLTTIDGLFNDTTGHNHGGPGEGGAITLAADSVPPTALLESLTQVGIAAPATFPPAGSWRLYPHADGQYFKIDSTGVELPIVAPGAIPDPLSIGTLIVLTSATVPPLTQAEQAATPVALPPVGSRHLYPKADGLYYTVDSAGVETQVGALPAVTPPVVLTADSLHSIGSTVIDQIVAALVTHGIVDDTNITP